MKRRWSAPETERRLRRSLAELEWSLSDMDAQLADHSAVARLSRVVSSLKTAEPSRLRERLLAVVPELEEQLGLLQEELASSLAGARDWRRRAGLAVSEGREDLAKQSEQRAREYEQNAAVLRLEAEHLEAAVLRCREVLSLTVAPE